MLALQSIFNPFPIMNIFILSNIKDFFELLSFLAIIVASFNYLWSKKQVHFSTMEHCIREFRGLAERDKSKEFTKNSSKILVKNYIELVNEEFFYFENNFLHQDVAIEWVDGMIDYLPFIDDNENVLNGKWTFTIINSKDKSETITIHELCQNYPRVWNAIKINNTIDFEIIYSDKINVERKKERDKLILIILSNLKISHWRKIHLKERIESRSSI